MILLRQLRWLLPLLGLIPPVHSQASADPFLDSLTTHVLQELSHLPDCTCLETLERFHKPAGNTGRLRPLDTVRLEVLYTGGRELYASPGDLRWETSPTAFPAAGIIGNGPFALYLRLIFATGDTLFDRHGAEMLAGRQMVRYDFRIPRLVSGQRLTVPGASATVGLKGAFWADPLSLDLLRLEVHADEIPADLPVFDFTTTATYARVRVGTEDVMLPQSAELHLLEDNGRENRAVIEFTHCRSFQTQSDLRFEAPPPIVANPPPASFSATGLARPQVEDTLPAGLRMVIVLTTPIAAEAAVGASIEGRITGRVRLQGRDLVPDGALVRGRVRRLERFSDQSGDYYVVGLEFSEIEFGGTLLRFFADLANIEGPPGMEWQWSTEHTATRGRVTTTQSTHLPELPGVGAFFVRGNQLNLPAGLRLIWNTRDFGR